VGEFVARVAFHKRVTSEQKAREANSSAVVSHVSGQLSTISWNRLDLYNEVWDQPLVKLSRRYGISDVRLGKVCRKLNIPHPDEAIGRRGWSVKRSNKCRYQNSRVRPSCGDLKHSRGVRRDDRGNQAIAYVGGSNLSGECERRGINGI